MTAPKFTLDQLRAEIAAGTIDTVMVAFTDMQGRLQGKRLHGHYFLDHALKGATEGCNYLLTVDVDMNTVDGYEMTSWERGYGDFLFELDMGTLRRTPAEPTCAMIQCDLAWLDGSGRVRQAPRSILLEQVERASAAGWTALAGTELEFNVYEETFEQAWDKQYVGMTPANRYNIDYSVLGGSRVEPLLRDIRNQMWAAGMVVESAKGECNLGQHEIGFLFDEVTRTCDNHVVYKTGAKQIAAQHGQSLTFMAKYDEREGNSCHIHMSLRGLEGEGAVVCADDSRPGGHSMLFDQFLAGMIATARELTYFYAPNINSYKRFADGSFAPTTIAWGRDNRTCAFRVVGHGPSLRLENRIPGGDVNPYLSSAAMLAGGLYGIENELELEDAFEGNAYTSDKDKVPSTLAQARELLLGSSVARAAFGDDVVEHYAHAAEVEVAAYAAAVTDWERKRGFERL